MIEFHRIYSKYKMIYSNLGAITNNYFNSRALMVEIVLKARYMLAIFIQTFVRLILEVFIAVHLKLVRSSIVLKHSHRIFRKVTI